MRRDCPVQRVAEESVSCLLDFVINNSVVSLRGLSNLYCECTKTVADCQSQLSEYVWLRLHTEFQDVFTQLFKSESEILFHLGY